MIKKRLPLILIIALLLASALVSYFAPKELDWTPSFSDADKRPYGTFMLSKLAEEIFDGKLKKIDSSFYQIDPDILKDTVSLNNYIVIANSWNPDSLSLKALYEMVDSGSCAFIASTAFPPNFEDSLGFTVTSDYSLKNDSILKGLNFTNPRIKSPSNYGYYKALSFSSFQKFDSSQTTILGAYNSGEINFIAVKRGKGYFFLNSANFAFTNYDISKSGFDYVSKALSYLPKDNYTIWDNHFSIDARKAETPLRFILSKDSLKWAYFSILFSAFLFILFKSKREQRIIPVIEPINNATIEFTQIIANLYLQKKNNLAMAQKKARHFLEFVRSKYLVNTDSAEEALAEKIANKSGAELALVQAIITQLNSANTKKSFSDEELIEFSKKIDKFYLKANYGKYE